MQKATSAIEMSKELRGNKKFENFASKSARTRGTAIAQDLELTHYDALNIRVPRRSQRGPRDNPSSESLALGWRRFREITSDSNARIPRAVAAAFRDYGLNLSAE